MFVLKDSNLQKHLDEISKGEFGKKLNATMLFMSKYSKKDCCYITLKKDNGFDIFVSIDLNEITEEYDERSWNTFPKLMPPDGVLMRVERESGECLGAYYNYIDECWYHDDLTFNDVRRYRLWDDD